MLRPVPALDEGLLPALARVTRRAVRRRGRHLGLQQQQQAAAKPRLQFSHYEAPFEFSSQLLKVTVDMHDDQRLDGEGVGAAEMARQ